MSSEKSNERIKRKLKAFIKFPILHISGGSDLMQSKFIIIAVKCYNQMRNQTNTITDTSILTDKMYSLEYSVNSAL